MKLVDLGERTTAFLADDGERGVNPALARSETRADLPPTFRIAGKPRLLGFALRFRAMMPGLFDRALDVLNL